MTTKEKINTVTELVKHFKEIEKVTNLVENLFGSNDGRLYNCVYTMFDTYTDTVSDLIGDEFQYVQWFIFENDCGKKGLVCKFKNKNYPIKTVVELISFIELTNNKK